MVSADRVHQLPADAHPRSCSADATFEHVADAQLTPDLAQVHRSALVGEGRVAGDHEERVHPAQSRDDVLHQPVGEVFLVGVAAHVGERQNCDRGFRGQGRRCSHRGAGVGLDAIGAHRPLDVLEAQVAEQREAAVELALKVVVGGARDDHGAGIGDAFEAGGDVDTVAVEVAVLLADHVAEIDADAEAYPLFLGRLRLVFCQSLLDRYRRGHRVDDTRELTQNAVASELDDPALMLGDQRFEEVLAVCLEPLECAALVALHQARIADHVASQDRCEAALRGHCTARPGACTRAALRPCPANFQTSNVHGIHLSQPLPIADSERGTQLDLAFTRFRYPACEAWSDPVTALTANRRHAHAASGDADTPLPEGRRYLLPLVTG